MWLVLGKHRVHRPVAAPPAISHLCVPRVTDGGLPWGEAALMDAQRAVRLVRWWAGHNASLNLDPRRVGLLGLSAGAHLAAHLAWRHDERTYPWVDQVDRLSALPDFQVWRI